MQSRLELHQRLSQRLTRQQLRFVRLLELNAPEMDDAVEHELEANPALTASEDSVEENRNEAADRSDTYVPPYHYSYRQSDSDTPGFTPRDNSESLADILKRQIAERGVPEDIAKTAEYIVGNIDSNGWLSRSLTQMLSDMEIYEGRHVNFPEGEKALELVRSLDPPGVGGESLPEILLLQLRRLPQSQERDDAINILSDYFREYHMRHAHKIISGLGISQKRLDAANHLILTLNPKPGAPYGGVDETSAAIIIPDFIVSDTEDGLSIQVNNKIPELAIEESFSEAMRNLKETRGSRKRGSEFISSRYNDARDFIALVRQRQQTLLSVMTAIVDLQKPYFETGDVFSLRPMMLKDVSAVTGLDISVVSRATANKYAAMPWGEVLPLKSFFSGRVNHSKDSDEETDSDAITNRQIQQAIARIISKEDPRHPLSDEKLRGKLKEEGYDISRRTIAKYRDRAGIQIARRRRKL